MLTTTDSQHYQDIADAIRSKNGQSTTYLPEEMPEAIHALQTVQNIRINDGKTRYRIDAGINRHVRLYIGSNTDSDTIDWGDGTTEHPEAGWATHDYNSDGEYVITITKGGTGEHTASLDSSNTNIVGISIGSQETTFTYGASNDQKHIVRELYVYANIKVPSFASAGALQIFEATDLKQEGITSFRDCYALIEATMKSSASSVYMDAGFRNSSNLRKLTLPSAITTNGYFLAWNNCIDAVKATIGGDGYVRGYDFGYMTKLTRVDLDGVTNILANAFNNSGELDTLILRADAVPALANTNAFGNTDIARGNGYIYMQDGIVEEAKTATNWATYADQIKPLSELPEA